MVFLWKKLSSWHSEMGKKTRRSVWYFATLKSGGKLVIASRHLFY